MHHRTSTKFCHNWSNPSWDMAIFDFQNGSLPPPFWIFKNSKFNSW